MHEVTTASRPRGLTPAPDAVDRPTSRVEAEVLRLRALLEKGEFAAALAGRRDAARTSPGESRRLVHHRREPAISAAHTRRLDDARAVRAIASGLQPALSGARPLPRRLKEAEPAIQAFLRAVNINPALPASWNALKILFKMTGRTADADLAGQHVAKLASLPAEVITATESVFGRRDHPGRADHPPVLAEARRSRRGHAIAGEDRHEARRATMIRNCCSSTHCVLEPDYHAHALRLRARAPRAAQACAGPRADSSGS